jgi:hypothetical protein
MKTGFARRPNPVTINRLGLARGRSLAKPGERRSNHRHTEIVLPLVSGLIMPSSFSNIAAKSDELNGHRDRQTDFAPGAVGGAITVLVKKTVRRARRIPPFEMRQFLEWYRSVTNAST